MKSPIKMINENKAVLSKIKTNNIYLCFFSPKDYQSNDRLPISKTRELFISAEQGITFLW